MRIDQWFQPVIEKPEWVCIRKSRFIDKDHQRENKSWQSGKTSLVLNLRASSFSVKNGVVIIRTSLSLSRLRKQEKFLRYFYPWRQFERLCNEGTAVIGFGIEYPYYLTAAVFCSRCIRWTAMMCYGPVWSANVNSDGGLPGDVLKRRCIPSTIHNTICRWEQSLYIFYERKWKHQNEWQWSICLLRQPMYSNGCIAERSALFRKGLSPSRRPSVGREW